MAALRTPAIGILPNPINAVGGSTTEWLHVYSNAVGGDSHSARSEMCLRTVYMELLTEFAGRAFTFL